MTQTTSASMIRCGVDIGGTFTDIVLEKGGNLFSIKVLTVHDAPESGILDGIEKVCAMASIAPSEIGMIIHGTTLATNALIERRGAQTAFITTEGFRDVIEMRTESRFEQYDLNLVLPEPLIPRDRRYPVRERILANGTVLENLDEDAVTAIAHHLRDEKIESIAVGFLHAYANPAHEHRTREIVLDILPEAAISLSSEVSPQMREYERFNTTVADAYVKPTMRSYLERLKSRLAEQDIKAEVMLIHSGGGIIDLASATKFPVRLVESGPAGGAIFAADIARRFSLKKTLSFDMGGTTAKICLIRDGAPKTSRSFEVARTWRFKKGSGMPISIPVIDMVEIGAGGGSIASVDQMQQIRIGPRSAGSEPGPASYQRGGNEATVTDADVILGKIDPDHFAGGSMKLSAEMATKAIDQNIGETLEMPTQMAAFGIAEMVDENMANAARVHAVENGEDLLGYTMIAFGGAGPLHAVRLARKLGIGRVLVPSSAGVGSAVGFLRAPFSFEKGRSLYMRLSEWQGEAVAETLASMAREAENFVRAAMPSASISTQAKAFMCYVGQGWDIPVTLNPDWLTEPDASSLKILFEKTYRRLFNRIVTGLDIEVTGWSVLATTPRPAITSLVAKDKKTFPKEKAIRVMSDPIDGGPVTAKVFERIDLIEGDRIIGPAVVVENETTVLIPEGGVAIMWADGTIDIQLDGKELTDGA